jgi:hypothetical protein
MQELLTLLFVLVAIPLLVLFGAYFFYLLLVAIHEMGHLVACKMVGYDWNFIVIGPLKIDKTSGRVSFSTSGQRFGGKLCPENGVSNPSIARNIITLLGGVSMNLLTGALALTAIPLVPASLSNWKFLLILIAVSSLFIATRNILPIKACGHATDGYLIKEQLRLRTAPAEAKRPDPAAEQARYDALMQLYRFREEGQRPKDWDAEIVRAAVAHGGKDVKSAIAAYLAFYWAEDCSDVIAAGRYIARAVQLMETVELSFRAYLPLDGAYHKAFYGRDPDNARRLLTMARSLLPENVEEKAGFQCGILRVEAAILFAEGKPVEALTKAKEAVSHLTDEHCGDKYMLERLISACGKEADKQSEC